MSFKLIVFPICVVSFSTYFLFSSCCKSHEVDSTVTVNVEDTPIVATLLQPLFKKTSEVHHNSDADYVFLQDNEGQEWIYKQITDPSPDDQIVIVLEAFASEIAKIASIPINEARTIPSNESFDCRFFDKYPGSLHRKVLGKCVESVSSWASDFDVQQKFRSPFLVARLGPLPSEEVGLRREVIQNMAKNKDLAKIVALDTYLGNSDRSSLNMFYHSEKEAFYGIDMGNCFVGNLAKCAKDKLKDFVSGGASFSKEELTGLSQYLETLLTLTSVFPPKETIALLESTLKQAGFTSDNPLLWDEDVEERIEKWKISIESNYKATLELVDFLSEEFSNVN